MKKSIGVIGLGIIGGVWARHYNDAGVLAGAWNRTPQPDFPRWMPSALDVAKTADVVQIVVADPPAVKGILDAILPALGAGKIVIQSSTIDPASSEEFKKLVEGAGARYLEAPFTGSKPAAEQKKSVYYLGGDAALIAEVEPLLSLVSEFRYTIGTNVQATTLKLAMNLNIAGQMQALAETLTMVRKVSVPDDLFFKVIRQNVSYSGVTALKEPKLRSGDFSPQFSVKHMLKDMRLASRTEGCDDFPVLDTVRECLFHADQAGYSNEDFSALIKLLK
ncbi:3-hydroxyisobutyrate dehydrogenase-like beta-hydroxyacid dehydrogenase [Ereboglobus sp. PH5-5]|uniref:NAD(P)-dependent oxidoreductase n=1 Tax=Ereboglobus sp. PH5-5 TaxID=2940529 RepID=UPI002405ED8D|nr:NAD(P)-dependent oxidoreductase [Ereboglobus sp. PH5-5]MDF9833865.1 3-hydroxyisobutyrate dehydrogenase-like beta-hydroxyacid dehydrogenase [Ereboglobus sp. PH5-5]